MPLPSTLHLSLVTPETTLLDEPVESVRVPLFDGEAGIYPGRAAMVGRLAAGELVVNRRSGGSDTWFVEGGFVQVSGENVAVLTGRAVKPNELDAAEADARLSEANTRAATGPDAARRETDQQRYRAMRASARKVR